MKPHAVDANAINTFQAERIADSPGKAHAKLSLIFQGNCIALDIEGLCQQEWLDCAGGKVPLALADWIADQQICGRIKYYPLFNNSCRKSLMLLGMPQNDHKWVRLAIGSGGKIIVTDDVDFFDPTKKMASAKTKEKIKTSGKGPCSKGLMKQFGIFVECL